MKAQLGESPLPSSLTQLLPSLRSSLAAGWKCQFLNTRVPSSAAHSMAAGSPQSEPATQTERERQKEVVLLWKLSQK